jgi:hypothetical protein
MAAKGYAMSRKDEKKDEKQSQPNVAALTIDSFCEQNAISRFTYYKMRRAGYGPDELRIPGTEIVRITPDAHERWRASRQEHEQTKAAKLENERRVAQRKAAGKRAAERAAERKSDGAALTKRGKRAA